MPNPSTLRSFKVGVISDTHGLLRPEAVRMLETCQKILHLGDIGNPEILKHLNRIAPTVAIRGNIDKGSWSTELPHEEVVEIGGRLIYLVHSIDELDLDPSVGFEAVLYGHSHVPKKYHKDGVLYFNPGSAGPKRFRLPISMGLITFADDCFDAQIIDLLQEEYWKKQAE